MKKNLITVMGVILTLFLGYVSVFSEPPPGSQSKTVTLFWMPPKNQSVSGYNVYESHHAGMWAGAKRIGMYYTTKTNFSINLTNQSEPGGNIFFFYVTSTNSNTHIESQPSKIVGYTNVINNSTNF